MSWKEGKLCIELTSRLYNGLEVLGDMYRVSAMK
jgi:hypothetical protein